jgi:hypothetical protein
MTTNKFAITVVTTDYEGADFPESDEFPQFVADALAEMYPSASVEVDGGASDTRVTVWGAPDGNEAELTSEIREWIRNEAWEDFVASF